MKEDTESQQDSSNIITRTHPNNTADDDHALVSFTYCKENEDQPVPENIQCLVILQPTRSIPKEMCYAHQQLQQILLPAGLQRIGEKAFFGCRSLREVILPLSTKSIGQLAFEGCSSLVTVSQVLNTDDSETNNTRHGQQKKDHHHTLSIGRSAISRFETLRRTVFSNVSSTTKIDDAIWYQAFKGCESLQRLVIPSANNVRAIKERAFEDCNCLSEIHLPDTLVQIQFCAFKNCRTLERIKIPPTVDVLASYLFLRCTALVDVTLAEGLKRIGNFAFAYCSSLETIQLPSTVKSIEKGAFSFCESLVSVAGLEVIGAAEADIHMKAFQECSSLQRMAFPAINKMLHSETLCNCKHLVQIHFSEGLIGIGHSALRGCESLRSMALPKSLKRIQAYAMAGCTNLVSVEIPKGTKARLNRHSFLGCEALANIVVPSSMVKLVSEDDAANANYFFSGCTLLQLQYASYTRSGGSIYECLEHRFEDFPIHELCYYASSTTREDLEKEIQKSTSRSCHDRKQQNIDMMNSMRDAMGMTPFHVLLSAFTRRLDLLEVLLDAYPATALLARDENGMNPLHYLISNWTVDARRMMQKCLQKSILDPLENWGLETWRKQMEQVVDSTCAEDCAMDHGNHEDRLETKLVRAVASLAMYKKLEVTSLLEQWLWKMALSCSHNNNYNGGEEADDDANNRSICRAKCGASFILPIVTTFLDDTTWETGF